MALFGPFTPGPGATPVAKHPYSTPETAMPTFQMQKFLSSSPKSVHTGISELLDELIKDL